MVRELRRSARVPAIANTPAANPNPAQHNAPAANLTFSAAVPRPARQPRATISATPPVRARRTNAEDSDVSAEANWDRVFPAGNQTGDDNGPMGSAVAASSDTRVAQGKRLRIYTHTFNRSINQIAIMSAAKTYDTHSDYAVIDKNYLILASYVIVRCGMVAKYMDNETEVLDGDWEYETLMPTNDAIAYATDLIKTNLIHLPTVLSMIVACKINWWTTNHHTITGEGTLPIILGKILKKLPTGLKAHKNSLHEGAHYASTLSVLTTLGKQVRPIIQVYPNASSFFAEEDMRLRPSAAPAGTHKFAYCHAAFSLMVNSGVLRKLTKDMALHISTAFTTYRKIMRSPERYHLGALHLTGIPREIFDDSMAPGGMAICFVKYCAAGGSVARAPYFIGNQNGGYKIMNGYSPEFEIIASCHAELASNRMG